MSTEAHVYMQRHQGAEAEHFDVSNVIYHKFSYGAVSYTLNAWLEKLTNANQSVSTVNDRQFPVELMEIADWTSISQYMLHSNFGQPLTRVIGGYFGAYTFILPLFLFPKYLSTFLNVLSMLKQNKNTLEFP